MSQDTDLSMQTIFSMAMLTLTSASVREDLTSLTEQATSEMDQILASKAMIKHIGTWDRLWGPVVWNHQESSSKYLPTDEVVADNTMFVTKQVTEDSSKEIYLISIMGTNPVSYYGWLDEDFDVSTTVPWSSVLKPGATSLLEGSISQGTYRGLDVLINTMKYKGQGLVDFLKANITDKNKSYDIYVTGHSLGGPLSLVTAFYLNDKRSDWDNDTGAVIKLFPFAGPTAGDDKFVTYATTRLSDQFPFFARFWNKNDVVPHVWRAKTVEEISTLYNPEIPTTPEIEAMVKWALNKAKGIDYVHVHESTPPMSVKNKSLKEEILEAMLKGIYKIIKPIYEKLLPDGDYKDTLSFILRLAWEHSIAYFILLDMLDILIIMVGNLIFSEGLVTRMLHTFSHLIKNLIHPELSLENLAHTEEIISEIQSVLNKFK